MWGCRLASQAGPRTNPCNQASCLFSTRGQALKNRMRRSIPLHGRQSSTLSRQATRALQAAAVLLAVCVSMSDAYLLGGPPVLAPRAVDAFQPRDPKPRAAALPPGPLRMAMGDGGAESEDVEEVEMARKRVGSATGGASAAQEAQAEAGLLGSWVLESEVESEETKIACKFKDKYIITIEGGDRGGTFRAAVEPRERSQPWIEYLLDPRHHVKGDWQRKPNDPVSEITLHILKRPQAGHQLDRYFVGKRDESGTKIIGTVLEGQKDPCYVGKFSMTLVVRSFSSLPVAHRNITDIE